MKAHAKRPAAARQPRMTQQERSARARVSLIEAAIQSICAKGFALTTMADIASLAGLTRGAIQHHFEGRDELVLAILHEVESRIVESFSDVLIDGDLELEQRVSRLIDHLGEVGMSEAYLAVVDIWISTRSEPGLRDAVRDSVLRASASYRELWQRAFGSDVSADAISQCRRVVVAVLRGSVISRIFVEEPRSYAMTLATTKAMVFRHMVSSAAEPQPVSMSA